MQIALFGYEYNRLYDLYYMAGLKPDQMRVASPFNDYAEGQLEFVPRDRPGNMDEAGGTRSRVSTFGAIYGKTKAMGYRNHHACPRGTPGRPIQSFCWTRCRRGCKNSYVKKFNTSIRVLARRQAAAWRRRQYRSSLRSRLPISAEMGSPTTRLTEKFPRGIHWHNPRSYRRYQILQRISRAGSECAIAS